jgi:hypothetical protein
LVNVSLFKTLQKHNQQQIIAFKIKKLVLCVKFEIRFLCRTNGLGKRCHCALPLQLKIHVRIWVGDSHWQQPCRNFQIFNNQFYASQKSGNMMWKIFESFTILLGFSFMRKPCTWKTIKTFLNLNWMFKFNKKGEAVCRSICLWMGKL